MGPQRRQRLAFPLLQARPLLGRQTRDRPGRPGPRRPKPDPRRVQILAGAGRPPRLLGLGRQDQRRPLGAGPPHRLVRPLQRLRLHRRPKSPRRPAGGFASFR